MEPEICTKMLKKLNEKLRAKFPATIPNYSMVKITRLDDALSEASPVEGQSLQEKDRKGEKGKAKGRRKKSKSLKNVVKCNASGKKKNAVMLQMSF